MTTKERLEFCTICKNRKVDFKNGLICNLTNEKPDFINICDSFTKDHDEAERKLKLKLDAAGNSRSQNGSLHPQRNLSYGIFLLVTGTLLLFFISLLFGIIVVTTGISFIIRANQQKKIIKEDELFNKKLSDNS